MPTIDDILTAQQIFDTAPLGAMIRYFDGTPKPPERFKRKLSEWKRTNDSGRLIAKTPPSRVGENLYPGTITLHTGDYGGNGIVVISCRMTFRLTSALHFEITQQPPPGSTQILSYGELVHLAESREAAATWLTQHGYPDAVLQDIPAAA